LSGFPAIYSSWFTGSDNWFHLVWTSCTRNNGPIPQLLIACSVATALHRIGYEDLTVSSCFMHFSQGGELSWIGEDDWLLQPWRPRLPIRLQPQMLSVPKPGGFQQQAHGPTSG
jgi:hypothetical protein